MCCYPPDKYCVENDVIRHALKKVLKFNLNCENIGNNFGFLNLQLHLSGSKDEKSLSLAASVSRG